MSGRGAPKGNQNAKGSVWSDTIRRAVLAQDGKKLRALADALINKALEGDTTALKEVGDRLEGKAVQSIVGADGAPLFGRVVREVVEPKG